jgi:methyl-accepting chemotaxis protein
VLAAEVATVRGLAEAKENAQQAEISGKNLREIDTLAAENERSMEVIAGTVQEILSFSRKVGETFQSLLEANRKNGEAAGEIAGSSKEVSIHSREVANTAQALLDMAKAERILLTRFRLEEES